MYVVEVVMQLFGQYIGEFVDVQVGGVGGQYGVIGYEWSDFFVQILFLVYMFGDGFDDQVVVFQLFQFGFVVGWGDCFGVGFVGEWGRVEFVQVVDGFEYDVVGWIFFGRQVEEYGIDVGVGQVGCDLGIYDIGI